MDTSTLMRAGLIVLLATLLSSGVEYAMVLFNGGDPRGWSSTWAMFRLLLSTACTVGLLVVWRALEPPARPASYWLGGLLVAVWWGASLADHAVDFETRGYEVHRVAGAFPFEPGRTVTEERPPYRFDTVIGPDGMRPCGVEQRGDRDVVLVGDSFVFGLLLPDEDTLCAHLAQTLDRQDLRLHNLGQPGANLSSYVDNARFAIETLQPRVIVVGFHVPVDAFLMDLNTQGTTVHSLPFKLVASVTHPEVTLHFVHSLSKWATTDGLIPLVVSDGLERLGVLADEADVPVLLFRYGAMMEDEVAARTGMVFSRAYDALAREAAEAHPRLHYAGWLPSPTEAAEPAWLELDGHPAGAGNAAWAAQLAPQLERLLEEVR